MEGNISTRAELKIYAYLFVGRCITKSSLWLIFRYPGSCQTIWASQASRSSLWPRGPSTARNQILLPYVIDTATQATPVTLLYTFPLYPYLLKQVSLLGEPSGAFPDFTSLLASF